MTLVTICRALSADGTRGWMVRWRDRRYVYQGRASRHRARWCRTWDEAHALRTSVQEYLARTERELRGDLASLPDASNSASR